MFDKSIESDKRNSDFPGSVTALGVLKGVRVETVNAISAMHHPSF